MMFRLAILSIGLLSISFGGCKWIGRGGVTDGKAVLIYVNRTPKGRQLLAMVDGQRRKIFSAVDFRYQVSPSRRKLLIEVTHWEHKFFIIEFTRSGFRRLNLPIKGSSGYWVSEDVITIIARRMEMYVDVRTFTVIDKKPFKSFYHERVKRIFSSEIAKLNKVLRNVTTQCKLCNKGKGIQHMKCCPDSVLELVLGSLPWMQLLRTKGVPESEITGIGSSVRPEMCLNKDGTLLAHTFNRGICVIKVPSGEIVGRTEYERGWCYDLTWWGSKLVYTWTLDWEFAGPCHIELWEPGRSKPKFICEGFEPNWIIWGGAPED